MNLTKKLFFITFALAIIIGNTGIWYMPNISDQFLISQNLTNIPFSNTSLHYLYTNYFEPFTFGLLGGTTFIQYLIYTMLISIVFFIIFGLWFIKYHSINNKDVYYKLFSIIIFPIFMVPFYWIGMDGMTLLLMLLIMINYRNKWSILYSILLGLQHFEQGIAGFLLLLGSLFIDYYLYKNKISYFYIKKTIYFISGLIIGKIILSIGFMIFDIELVNNRYQYFEKNSILFLNQWIRSWPYILFSFFGIGWLLILKNLKTTYPLLVATVVTFIFVMTVGDQTRVGSIILFPSLFYWLFKNKNIIQSISYKYIIITVSSYLLIPVVYVWSGYPLGSLFTYDIKIFKEIKNDNYTLDFSTPYREQNTLNFNSIIINGSSLNGMIGKNKNKFKVAESSSDKSGYLTYGPYIQLEKGNYKFNISYISSETNTTIIGNWDVGIYINKKFNQIDSGYLLGTNNQEAHIIQKFSINKQYSNQKIEVRNFYNATGKLTIKSLTITKIN